MSCRFAIPVRVDRERSATPNAAETLRAAVRRAGRRTDGTGSDPSRERRVSPAGPVGAATAAPGVGGSRDGVGERSFAGVRSSGSRAAASVAVVRAGAGLDHASPAGSVA